MTAKLNPYLNFNGDTKEAMEFYKSVLGGELTMQTMGESGMTVVDEYKDQIIHAQLTSGDIILMASDTADHGKAEFGTSVQLSLVGSDENTLTEIFNKLAEGGKIDMPLQKQFWGDIFGMLTDKYNIHWMVNIAASKPAK